MKARRLFLVISSALLVSGGLFVYFGNALIRHFESRSASVSHGTSNRGSLEYGKRLPTSGGNFHAYSRFGALLGRASVHSTVREIVLAAYGRMKVERPEVEWIYGESGWPSGGPFPPHRTHENGSSVDFFVPVIDDRGHPAELPTWPWRKFGYNIEFDSTGHWGGYRIDFEAVALHLLALQEEGKARGAPVIRVIFAPEFRDELARSDAGRRALRAMPWMVGRPWVRHDEHYHVDFAVPGSQGVG